MDELIIMCPNCGHMDNEYWMKSEEGVARVKCADCNKTILADFRTIVEVKNIRIEKKDA